MNYQEPSAEVVAQIKDLFHSWGGNEKFKLRTTASGYYIEVKQSYEYVGFKSGSVLQNYMKIAELLNVKDGDEVSRVGYAGCETCDWGSSYELELRFW